MVVDSFEFITPNSNIGLLTFCDFNSLKLFDFSFLFNKTKVEKSLSTISLTFYIICFINACSKNVKATCIKNLKKVFNLLIKMFLIKFDINCEILLLCMSDKEKVKPNTAVFIILLYFN